MVENQFVGKRFKSKNYGWFTVTKETNEKQNNIRLFEIEFDKWNDVKYKILATKSNIKRGAVKNPYYPSFFNIGYLGNGRCTDNMMIHKRWTNMLSRCYNINNKRYKNYGGRGVTVCKRWLCFENFLQDFPLLEGYDENNLENLEIDKDSKIFDNRVYALETCMLVSKAENMKEMNERMHQKWFKAISPEGKIYESNNQHEFARKQNLIAGCINQILNKKRKTHKGWKFEYLE